MQFKDGLVQLHTSAFHCSAQHGSEIPRLMSKPRQRWWWERKRRDPPPVPRGLADVRVCDGGGRDWGSLGSSSPIPVAASTPAHTGVSASSGFPIRNLHTGMGKGRAGTALRLLHRLRLHPVPSLHHDTNFQGSLKIQIKINKQSPDLPERNCWSSSEQFFGKTYFSRSRFRQFLEQVGLFIFAL